MKNIYFDITDIVEYARNHSHVSGIQRVQARVIAALAAKHGGRRIVCTFWNHVNGTYCQVPADDVFSSGEFDPRVLLYKLGATKKYWLIDKSEVKKYLQKYNHKKIYRGLKKIELYLRAIFTPSALDGLGIQRELLLHNIKPLEVNLIEKIPASDVLVFLGANWSDSALLSIGRSHRAVGGEVIQMIYDLIPYTQPKYFTNGLVEAYSGFLKSTPDYVTSFTCISEWTSQDLRGFLGDVPNYNPDVRTVPLAHEFAGFTRDQRLVKPADPALLHLVENGPFVLCVGTIEIRKNGANLLKAWQRLIGEGGKIPRLVFAGKYGWKIDEFMNLLGTDQSLAALVTVVQSPSDQDLAFLYEHCQFTVYPSFYEGWGLPVGEAAWFGKFCLASSATSVPEVCGDLIDYVAPDDVVAMASKVRYLMENDEYVINKEHAIRAAALRTWADVADDLFGFIQNELNTCARPSTQQGAARHVG